ncbi:MAG TPA: hypothetical protein VG722_09955 [Tepidisphaeraceae bacterium]|nr:hypothetical protein [Tepidisphaeraceae bacterium]
MENNPTRKILSNDCDYIFRSTSRMNGEDLIAEFGTSRNDSLEKFALTLVQPVILDDVIEPDFTYVTSLRQEIKKTFDLFAVRLYKFGVKAGRRSNKRASGSELLGVFEHEWCIGYSDRVHTRSFARGDDRSGVRKQINMAMGINGWEASLFGVWIHHSIVALFRKFFTSSMPLR